MSITYLKLGENLKDTVGQSFPTILHVSLLIAYDNGMVNRNESEEDFLKSVCMILAYKPIMKLIQLEHWLKTLNNIQLNIIAVGEQSLMENIMQDCPDFDFSDKLFNAIFNEETGEE